MAFTSVGAALRSERVRQGLTLADLAKRTRISQKFLTEIESENFEALPGAVFARSFVRSYAAELHIDPGPLLSELPRVDVDVSPMPNPRKPEGRSGWNPRWNPAFASIAWTLLAVGAATAAYIHFNRPVVAIPAKHASVLKQDAVKQVAPAPALQPTAVALPPLVKTGMYPVQVVLTARETSWVQITADGRNTFTGVLQPKDKREVEADELVKVVTGNAGGLQIALNGKLIDSLGPAGQVRTVRLTAEGPQLVLKTPPPPQPASDPL